MDTPNEWEIAFDEETWRRMPSFLNHLPEPVCLHIWADESGSRYEREAVRLGRLFESTFAPVSCRILPRRADYFYYPVFGIMHGTADDATDQGLRIVGLPMGYQMTALVGGIQAVAFQAQTMEAATRIRLHRLGQEKPDKLLSCELLTGAEDEAGAQMASTLFNMAVASEQFRVYVVIADQFPDEVRNYSATHLPHLVINKRVHYSGYLDETAILKQAALAATKH